MKKRLISGVKPSGELHLGNYLGALSQWTHLQNEYEVFLFVADLHAITVL
jgi:tryptophanyl-tRNA synthetase